MQVARYGVAQAWKQNLDQMKRGIAALGLRLVVTSSGKSGIRRQPVCSDWTFGGESSEKLTIGLEPRWMLLVRISPIYTWSQK